MRTDFRCRLIKMKCVINYKNEIVFNIFCVRLCIQTNCSFRIIKVKSTADLAILLVVYVVTVVSGQLILKVQFDISE